MPGSAGERGPMGSSAAILPHAVGQQVDIARPAQRQHQRRKERCADREQRGTDRRPPHRRQQNQGGDRNPGNHHPGPQRQHGYLPESKRWWRARTPRSIAAAISGSSCSSLRTKSSISSVRCFATWLAATTSQASA